MNWLESLMKSFDMFLDALAHFIKELFDALNSKGGGIFVALLIFYSSFFMWKTTQLDEIKNVVVFSAGTLVGLAGGERLANGKGKNPPPSDPPTQG